MIVGLIPGQRVALELDGHVVVGAFRRVGSRDEQVTIEDPVMGRRLTDAAIVELDDGQVVATPYHRLVLPDSRDRSRK